MAVRLAVRPHPTKTFQDLPHGPIGSPGGRLTLRQSRREGPPMSGMGRREFVALFGGAAATWPLVARAQQAGMPVVGFLNGASAGTFAGNVAAFHQGLKESGFVEGQNVTV